MNPRSYPSDLTDAQWAVLEPLLPRAKPLGGPRKNDLRRVLDAIFFRNRNGCTWRALPLVRRSQGPGVAVLLRFGEKSIKLE